MFHPICFLLLIIVVIAGCGDNSGDQYSDPQYQFSPICTPVDEINPIDYLPTYQPLQLGSDTKVIKIPDDYLTINEGIDAATNDDAIIVASGTYYENINFSGKNITIYSEKGPDHTIIDGGQADSVVFFWNSETSKAVLHGFTITKGLPKNELSFPLGGGISIRNASPTITSCHIIKNGAQHGGGIIISGQNASPIIQDNLISGNIGTETGGGIEARNGCLPIIKNNVFLENISMIGSAIEIANGALPVVEGNIINDNSSGYDMHAEHAQQHLNGMDITKNLVNTDRLAASIFIADNCSPVIRDNEIIGNLGGGISVMLGSSPLIKDNLISGNFGGRRFTSGILVAQNSYPVLIRNQIDCNQAGALWVDDTSDILDKEQKPIHIEECRIIEDTDDEFEFSGDWDIWFGSWGSHHSSIQIGATAKVQFTGKGVSLIYFAYPNNGGIVDINIDGVPYQPADTYCPNKHSGGKAEHFIADNLAPASHTLTITVTGQMNALSSGAGLSLDAVGVISDTNLGDNTIQGAIVTWPPLSDDNHAPLSPGKMLYVPDHFTSIQAAISSANDGDTIIVEPGLYTENIDFLGKIISLKSSNPSDNLIIESTVIEASNASPTVIFTRGETRESSLEGITIINGFGEKAIQIYSSNPTIKGNVIKDSSGGGILCEYDSSPLITDNKIINNGSGSGFGIKCMLSSPRITNNCIIDNLGSGIVTYFSQPFIGNNIISNNIGSSGISLDHFSQASIQGNTITDNMGFGGGGWGILLDSFCNSFIDGNVINNNQYFGIMMINDCTPLVTNNIIANNLGAMVSCMSRPDLIHNTLVGNTNHGLYAVGISKASIKNSILWENIPVAKSSYAEVNVTYSNIKTIWQGEGNISQDPLFVSENDYHLSQNSPCVDAGIGTAITSDKDGVIRPQLGGYDIGAYEYVDE